ncbi:hypothetical protein ACFSL6_17845 [Paenibacillus thailandensis]|uniref:Uncharacterized protein n=1 Tax=Paenibacillus thailandensis TaxID=393250 RepID=A0ABW5R2W3_9BACL
MAYSNVRIIPKVREAITGFGLFGPVRERVEIDAGTWLVIYHTGTQRWIVTNDIDKHGLNAAAADLVPVGFANSVKAALFVVWEHQRSLGLDRTILDELREKKDARLVADETEWEWKS